MMRLRAADSGIKLKSSLRLVGLAVSKLLLYTFSTILMLLVLTVNLFALTFYAVQGISLSSATWAKALKGTTIIFTMWFIYNQLS